MVCSKGCQTKLHLCFDCCYLLVLHNLMIIFDYSVATHSSCGVGSRYPLLTPNLLQVLFRLSLNQIG